jgi:mono/diheme cytochrome c family protein
MSANPSLSLRLRQLLLAALLLVICFLVLRWLIEQNKPWVVPAEYKTLKNPLLSTDSNLSSARQIYRDECAQCHGERGQGDGPEARSHYPLPADLTDAGHMATVKDGEIFYQITAGRRPMPSYKNRLTQAQRWQLVLLVRSFSQPPAANDSPANNAPVAPLSSKPSSQP